MTALERRRSGVSLFDQLFGNPWGMLEKVPSSPLFQTSEVKYYTHGISERIEDNTYIAEVTLPDGFDMEQVKAEVQGNILRVRVPRIEAEAREVEVTKAGETPAES